jgi:hypothetical protein
MDRSLRADSRNKSGDAYASRQTAMMRRALRTREKPLARYIKNGVIIEWDFTEPLIAKFLNKFGDDAKVNWSVSEFTEFVANKLHEALPKYEEVVTKSMTILRYAMPRHVGPMHDYFLPLRSLISNVESALDLADSISTSQMVSLAAHHKDSHGRHIFQVALVELQNPEEENQFDLCVFIRANPILVQHMGLSSTGQVLQQFDQIEEEQQMREQHAAELKRKRTQQNEESQSEPWSQESSSLQQRPYQKTHRGQRPENKNEKR